MRKIQNAKQFIAVCLALGMALLPANAIKALAAEVVATVEGTVLSGTTSDILKLSTREGDMEIKLDSGTDTSACKILLPDKKISVSVSHGSDGYMHAVKITGEAQASSVSVDASTTATVTGYASGADGDQAGSHHEYQRMLGADSGKKLFHHLCQGFRRLHACGEYFRRDGGNKRLIQHGKQLIRAYACAGFRHKCVHVHRNGQGLRQHQGGGSFVPENK